jgi:hypothetical protein
LDVLAAVQGAAAKVTGTFSEHKFSGFRVLGTQRPCDSVTLCGDLIVDSSSTVPFHLRSGQRGRTDYYVRKTSNAFLLATHRADSHLHRHAVNEQVYSGSDPFYDR